MIAFYLYVDFSTAFRAGGINPEGKRFPVVAQNTEGGDCEIRLCENDADVAHIRELVAAGVEGITLFDGDAEIDAALDEYIYTGDNGRTRYQTFDSALALAYVERRGLGLLDMKGMSDPEQVAKWYYDHDVPGVARHEPVRIRAADVRERRDKIARHKANAAAVNEAIRDRRRVEKAEARDNEPEGTAQ